MSVAGANKVEGTMSWCVGTNEILASNMTALKSQARALWERHLDLRNFFVFYYGWKCLEAQNWNIFMIQTLSRGVARIFQRGGGGVTEAVHQIVPFVQISTNRFHLPKNGAKNIPETGINTNFRFEHSVWENGTSFSNVLLLPEIFRWNNPKSVPFTFQPDFPET